MKQLSNLEFVILSLVAERPVHGYQIEQLINERGMRDWTDIGFSSIYHVLRKQQKVGFLTCKSESSNDRPARKVFSLTPKGTNLLHAEVLHRLSTPCPYSADIDLALSCLPVLNNEEIQNSLESFHKELSRKIQDVKEKQSANANRMEPHVEALFEHSLNTMHAELDWISKYLSKMETTMESNQNDLYKKLYSPSAKAPQILDIPTMNFLMIDGHGDPNNNPVYQAAVSALYTLSYTLKFDLKKTGGTPEYKIFPLQGLWWAADMDSFVTGNKSAWDWTMMIAQPEWITKELIDKAHKIAAAKVEAQILQQVRFEPYSEGTVVQLLHIGPYSAEGPNIARIHEFARQQGYELAGKHHEIYLSDPGRSAPEKLKTIIRQPIRKQTFK